METQKNLLSIVTKMLRARGEEIEWIPIPDRSDEKIGLAYVPLELDTLCSFMFTEVKTPSSLTLDVLFATHIRHEDYLEVGIMLQELNTNQREGAFMLDVDAGYVYYRQTLMAEGVELTDAQITQAVINMEETGRRMTKVFARWLTDNFHSL